MIADLSMRYRRQFPGPGCHQDQGRCFRKTSIPLTNRVLAQHLMIPNHQKLAMHHRNSRLDLNSRSRSALILNLNPAQSQMLD